MNGRAGVLSVALLSVLSLGACGGGGESADSLASAGETTSAKERAGAAAAFLQPHGDNSIPTFGTEAPPAERGQAELVLRGYLAARAAGAWADACGALAAPLVVQLEELGSGRSCADTFAALFESPSGSSLADLWRGQLLSLRVKGNSGFALFFGPGKQKFVIPMSRKGGAWKVARLTPFPYPLSSR